jgi:hypothetical protein
MPGGAQAHGALREVQCGHGVIYLFIYFILNVNPFVI